MRQWGRCVVPCRWGAGCVSAGTAETMKPLIPDLYSRVRLDPLRATHKHLEREGQVCCQESGQCILCVLWCGLRRIPAYLGAAELAGAPSWGGGDGHTQASDQCGC